MHYKRRKPRRVVRAKAFSERPMGNSESRRGIGTRSERERQSEVLLEFLSHRRSALTQ